jgi:hypothetical protein
MISLFRSSVNALVNEGSGVAVLHSPSLQCLMGFNEKVGDKLVDMLPNNLYYHELFEVSIYDNKHVLFRVKSARKSSRSYAQFNTKLSLDKGLGKPTHGQFQRMVEECSQQDQQPTSKALQTTLVFKTDAQGKKLAKLKRVGRSGEGELLHFVEGVGVEAKSLIGIKKLTAGNNSVDKLVCYIWETCQLPQYITAFARLENGGRVFIGLEEEKIKKGTQELKTGQFVLDEDGVQELRTLRLTGAKQQREAEQQLQEKAAREMRWHPQSPQLPMIDVKFVPTAQGYTDHYFIEIVVKPFKGLVFYDREGPETYLLMSDPQEPATKKPRRLPFEDWIKTCK